MTIEVAEDSGKMTLDLFANLGLSVNKLSESVNKQTRIEQAKLARQPNYVPLAKLSQPGAATTDVQDLGGPLPGRTWMVRSLGTLSSPLVTPTVNTSTPSSVVSSAPAAGAETVFTVPAGHNYTLYSVLFDLTTSVTVANRQVTLIIDDGVNELWRIILPVTQAASLTYRYVFGGSSNDGAVRTIGATNEVLSELPANLVLGPGYRIRTVTANIQAGDQYTGIRLGVTDTTLGVTGSTAIVTWYVGQVMPGPAAGQLPSTMARWQQSTPAFQTFTSDVIKVMPGEHLIAGLTNVPANSSSIAVLAAVNDQPLYVTVPVE